MNQWRDGWPRDDDRDRYGRGSSSAQPEDVRAMRQVRRDEPPMPPRPPRRPDVPPQGDYDDRYDGYSDGQVYGGGRGRGGPPRDRYDRYGDRRGPYGRDPYGRYPGPPRPHWGRRIKRTLIMLLVVVLAVTVGTYFWADSKMRKEVDLSKVINRAEAGDGTNYLIVGSDSREGMSSQQKKDLHTGDAAGTRTDSMMILHDGANGPTLISLPRDSWVTIPNFKGSDSGKMYPSPGGNKLNAAYAQDGPELLVRTVEYNTGLHIDHYAEIGFAGFANIVDAMGGVEMNIEKGFKDPKSGADFKSGTQTLNGQQSLAFVRSRYAFAQSDLDRTKNQQKFLSALANQAASPATILNPFQLYPVMGAGLETLIVDKEMTPYSLAMMFFAMKGVNSGEGTSMNMPTSGGAPMGSLQWDKAKVRQLVDQLNNDQKVTVSDES